MMRKSLRMAACAALLAGPALGQTAEKVATCGGFAEGVNLAADGSLWVVDVFGDRIIRIADGECADVAPGAGRPNGAKFDAQGRLVLAEGEGLMAYDPADGSMAPVATAYQDEPLRELNDLVIDPEGGIYFTAPAGSDLANPTGRVFYLPPGSDAPELVGQGLAFPNGVALSRDGLLVYVAEFAAKRILAMPTVGAGGFRTTYVWALTEGGIGADGMTVGPDGTLYAAIFGAGEVMSFDSEGHHLNTYVLPEDAGAQTTNVLVHDGWLYVTEAAMGEVWRFPLD